MDIEDEAGNRQLAGKTGGETPPSRPAAGTPQLRNDPNGLGLHGGRGPGDFSGEMHDLVSAFPLALLHSVHHGAVVTLIGVEDFSPFFADFGDELIVIHGLGLQGFRWVCRWSVGRTHCPGSLDPVS